jgi:hypothetical protein
MKDRFSKFAGTSLFPNSKKRSRFQCFLFDVMHWCLCLIGKHDLAEYRIENEIYKYCKRCTYTESNGIKVKRVYSENVEFL